MLALLLTACNDRPNSKPTYGDTGLPKNCRAIVMANVDSYRHTKSEIDTAYEMMSNPANYKELYEQVDFLREKLDEIDGYIQSLDRNCGEYGYSWEFD